MLFKYAGLGACSHHFARSMAKSSFPFGKYHDFSKLRELMALLKQVGYHIRPSRCLLIGMELLHLETKQENWEICLCDSLNNHCWLTGSRRHAVGEPPD